MKHDNKKQTKKSFQFKYIVKKSRATILVKSLYIESKVKTFIFNIFSKNIYKELLNYKKFSKNHNYNSSIFKNKNNRLQKTVDFLIEDLKKSKMKFSKLNNGDFCDELTLGQVNMLIELIDVPAKLHKIIKINTQETSANIKIVEEIRRLRNTLSHPPRNPQITFLRLINKSKLQKNKRFENLQKIHNTLDKVDKFFEKVNKDLQKQKNIAQNPKK